MHSLLDLRQKQLKVNVLFHLYLILSTCHRFSLPFDTFVALSDSLTFRKKRKNLCACNSIPAVISSLCDRNFFCFSFPTTLIVSRRLCTVFTAQVSMGSTHKARSSPSSSNLFGHDRQATKRSRKYDPLRRPRRDEHEDSPVRGLPAVQPEYTVNIPPTMLSIQDTAAHSLSAPVDHAGSFAMERTSSGKSIVSDSTFEPQHKYTFNTCTDEQAAKKVENHHKMQSPYSRNSRILRGLIMSSNARDDEALDSILFTADSVFFAGDLADRVTWEWSDDHSQPRYKNELIGTTSLRHAVQGGIETLIVLSKPILCSSNYDRRLLLSAFLHELIHCYLFIKCGFDARVKGGHTQGFHTIADIIDRWVGRGHLNLCNMKANLNHFRLGSSTEMVGQCLEKSKHGHKHPGCNQSPRPGHHKEELVYVRRGQYV